MYTRHVAAGGGGEGRARRGAALAALTLFAALLCAAHAGVAARGAQSDRLTVEVTDSGFTPAQAAADPGLVHLTLRNGGGSERVRLSVAKQGGAVLRELEVEGRGGSLATELEVEAGAVYTLTEAEHGWVFKLTVSGSATAPPAQAPPEE